jgi:hypothetical protein
VAANGSLRRVLLGAVVREIRDGLAGGASLAATLDEPTPKVLATFLETWFQESGDESLVRLALVVEGLIRHRHVLGFSSFSPVTR